MERPNIQIVAHRLPGAPAIIAALELPPGCRKRHLWIVGLRPDGLHWHALERSANPQPAPEATRIAEHHQAMSCADEQQGCFCHANLLKNKEQRLENLADFCVLY